ncbi:RNA polymerase sigma factor FliA [Pseudonocardia phyllosphaerae]|uniref:RNA polymerase sigma factor FliA n=1 Tax=Pseudonocardia phyllosphaerae TaxID=3390502 RepID=UPI00397890F2
MTRPTLGRESSRASRTSSSPLHRPDPFPSVLASALARHAGGTVPGLARVRSVGHGARDTPGQVRDHLIETVDPEAVGRWRAFLSGRDPAARCRLVEHYTDLVRGVGMKLAVRLPSSIEAADLVQSGTFGLMEAIDRFDPARGVRFEGYAAQRIRGAMLDELRAQDWVPRTVRSRTREVERAREALLLRLGRPANDRELALELGVAVRELRAATRPVHLVSADDLGEGTEVLARLPADAADPVVVAEQGEIRAALCAAIALLDERDRLVVQLYYLENRTLAEIGARLGVTESRVCQLHGRLILRLRGRLQDALAC